MPKFNKIGKYYERHLINGVKKTEKYNTNGHSDVTKDAMANVDISLFVYTIFVYYWCKYTSMSDAQIITGTFLIVVFNSIIKSITHKTKGEL